jgi:hypothetical protein
LSAKTTPAESRIAAMNRVNPVYIPRNHMVEAALESATRGDLKPFERLVDVLADPSPRAPGLEVFALGAPSDFGPTPPIAAPESGRLLQWRWKKHPAQAIVGPDLRPETQRVVTQNMHFDLVVLAILVAFILYSLVTRFIDRSLLTLPIIFMCLGFALSEPTAQPRRPR